MMPHQSGIRPGDRVTVEEWEVEEEILKQGPLFKKGGGESLFGRKNWKLRWFVLWRTRLCYYKAEPFNPHSLKSPREEVSSPRSHGGIPFPAPHLLRKIASDAKENTTQTNPSAAANEKGSELKVKGHQRSRSGGSPPLISQPLGRIELKDVTSVQPVHDSDSASRSDSECIFKVITPYRTYFFSCKDHAVAADWITELRRLLFEIQNPDNVRMRSGSLLQPNKSLENIFTAFENSPRIVRPTPGQSVYFDTFQFSCSPPSPIGLRHNTPPNIRRGSASVPLHPILRKNTSVAIPSALTPSNSVALEEFPYDEKRSRRLSLSPPSPRRHLAWKSPVAPNNTLSNSSIEALDRVEF